MPDDQYDKKSAFGKFFFDRIGALGMPFITQEVSRYYGQHEGTPKWASGEYLNPRQHLPVEDERGMTMPELNLKAQYLKSIGAYNRLPPFDPATPITPLGREAGAANIAKYTPEDLRKMGEDYLNDLKSQGIDTVKMGLEPPPPLPVPRPKMPTS